MNAALPLFSRTTDAPLLWNQGQPISRAAFAAAARRLADRLPEAGSTLNRCRTRSGFLVALVASALRQLPCRLAAPEARQPPHGIIGRAPVCVLAEDARTADVAVPPIAAESEDPTPLPLAPADGPFAIVTTSGSTGHPRAYPKSWLALSHAARQIAMRLLPAQPARLVATVPMHHMYGLETAVILPLVTPHSVVEGRPAFPQDVRAALESVAAPRVLVTAPVHLRALVQARTPLPPLHAIISATAPLSPDTARLAEQRFQTQVLEIYGCTEAGSVASRRTVSSASWHPLDTMQIKTGARGCRVVAPHLAGPVALHDLLEDDGEGGFLLRGRDGDIVKVGGKRASLTTLTQCLLSIPGVDDGVVFQPQQQRAAAIAHRLAAFVVAPRLRTTEILAALGQRVDPVFLPRPLRRVERLPRNATGKLPRQLLEQMLRRD